MIYAQAGQSERGIAALGSMTAAIKAQHVLLSAGVSAQVISLSPGETRRGCAYGVEYPAVSENTVKSALRAARISPSQYLRKSGGTL